MNFYDELLADVNELLESKKLLSNKNLIPPSVVEQLMELKKQIILSQQMDPDVNTPSCVSRIHGVACTLKKWLDSQSSINTVLPKIVCNKILDKTQKYCDELLNVSDILYNTSAKH